jgi:hypothetical protein
MSITALAASANKFIPSMEGDRERERERKREKNREREKTSANVASALISFSNIW